MLGPGADLPALYAPQNFLARHGGSQGLARHGGDLGEQVPHAAEDGLDERGERFQERRVALALGETVGDGFLEVDLIALPLIAGCDVVAVEPSLVDGVGFQRMPLPVVDQAGGAQGVDRLVAAGADRVVGFQRPGDDVLQPVAVVGAHDAVALLRIGRVGQAAVGLGLGEGGEAGDLGVHLVDQGGHRGLWLAY